MKPNPLQTRNYAYWRLQHLMVLFDMLSDEQQLISSIAYVDQRFPETLSDVLNAREIVKIDKHGKRLKCHYYGGDGKFRIGYLKGTEIDKGIREILGFLKKDLKSRNQLN